MTHEDELPDRQRARLMRASSPGQKAAGWATWHAGELAAVLAPSALAVVATPWAWVLTAASAGAWAVHEVRQTRSRRALQHEHTAENTAVASTNSTGARGSEHAEHEQTDDDALVAGEEVRHG